MQADFRMMIAVAAIRMAMHHLANIRRETREDRSQFIWITTEIKYLYRVYERLKTDNLYGHRRV